MKKILAGLVAFALTMGAASATSFLTLGNQEEKPTGLQSLVSIVNSNFSTIALGQVTEVQLPGYIKIGNAISASTAVAISGDVSIGSGGAVTIGTRRVTSAMMPALPTGQVFVGGATSNAAGQTLSGVITCDVTGLTAFVASGALSTNTFQDVTSNTVTVIWRDVGGYKLLVSWTGP